MNRPAFQFYPGDWQRNMKLRRCSKAARGEWIDVLCLMHDSDEYGVLRWPLCEIAEATNAPIKLLRELVEKGVLKGADHDVPAFVYTPRHAGKDGEPVTLLEASAGACWYSSRFVRDEWIRKRRGENTRFGEGGEGQQPPPKPPPNKQPKVTPKVPIGTHFGDGPAVAVAVASAVDLVNLESYRDRGVGKEFAEPPKTTDELSLAPTTLKDDKKEPKINGHSKATRLPNDWHLPDEYREWAMDVFKIDRAKVALTGAKFKDFWIAKSGQNATKLDWLATWRNWCRREFENGK